MSSLGLRRSFRTWPRCLPPVSVDFKLHIHRRGQLCLSKASREYSASYHEPSIKKTRNIGIIAHIDAVRYQSVSKNETEPGALTV